MGFGYKDCTQIVAICTLVTVFKFFLTALGLGLKRQRAPEDGFNNKTSELKENLNSNGEPVFDESKRYGRIVMNDLENIPLGLIVMWSQIFVGSIAFNNNDGYWQSCSGLAICFVIGRVLHSICYIYSLMPWRTIAWAIALLSMFGMGITTVYASFEI